MEYSSESPRIKQLIQSALELTRSNLTYTFGSADPERGGMDCSGFVYYILKQNGFKEVPRDSSGLYVWLRKAGTFRAVLSSNPESFEFDELRPGDLLFWTGSYAVDRDPPVSHSAIYLGREKGAKNRIMVASSDGQTYRGKQRWGVSVFDFRLRKASAASEGRARGQFVGYARIPGLRNER